MNDFIHKYGKPDVHFDSTKVESEKLADNRDLSDAHIDKLISYEKPESVHTALIRNPSIGTSHVDVLFNVAQDKGYGGEFYENAMERKDIPSHHIDAALSLGDSDVDEHIAKHPNTTTKQINTLIKRGDDYPLHEIARRKNLAPSIINRLMNINDYHLNKVIRKREDLTTEHKLKLDSR